MIALLSLIVVGTFMGVGIAVALNALVDLAVDFDERGRARVARARKAGRL